MRGMHLSADDLLRRAIIQALMCRFALSMDAMGESFGIDFRQYFAPELERLADHADLGLLTMDEEWITITPKGRFLIRTIAMVFDRHLRERTTKARYSRTI